MPPPEYKKIVPNSVLSLFDTIIKLYVIRLFVETRRETLALSVKTIYNLCETKYPV